MGLWVPWDGASLHTEDVPKKQLQLFIYLNNLEASSLLFSGVEKSHGALAAKEPIFNSPAGVGATFPLFQLGTVGLKLPWAHRDADRDVRQDRWGTSLFS